jgi:predicted transcriptional regulator
MCTARIHIWWRRENDERDGDGGYPMKHRRSRLEVYLDVMWTIKSGTRKPTRIMYGANLSWKPLQRVLDSLISQGLVADTEPFDLKDKRTNTCYELTQKGENVLNYFNKAKELLMLETAPNILF